MLLGEWQFLHNFSTFYYYFFCLSSMACPQHNWRRSIYIFYVGWR